MGKIFNTVVDFLTDDGWKYTILEDDSTISFSTNGLSGNENSSTVTLTLSRSGGTNGTSTVDFYTADGTATNAVD